MPAITGTLCSNPKSVARIGVMTFGAKLTYQIIGREKKVLVEPE